MCGKRQQGKVHLSVLKAGWIPLVYVAEIAQYSQYNQAGEVGEGVVWDVCDPVKGQRQGLQVTLVL